MLYHAKPMSMITDDVIEAAWNEIASLPESKAEQEIQRITEKQPALLAFVMADTNDVSQEAKELGLFLFVIVLRMFEKHYGSNLRTVEIERIEQLQDQLEKSLEALVNLEGEELEQAVLAQASAQPWVIQYIGEALFEPDPEDGVKLTEQETGALVLTLRTVVDALEEAAH
jgi:hypothetical protein